ncbi:MAG TPA: orotate phosphoribosyltransferase [Eubacteriales bacterium]|jgi:orotate phosphoribosyltransferase|nr:orotate phosphoribosyltransferase [Eubacteriales bacterium]HRU84165.1 orotate phosphoribosyltransferase [Eubacteriales bacterium]
MGNYFLKIKEEVALKLLEIKAVFLRPSQPFTWASGIKSPIYCDNRLILAAPEARNFIENALAELIKENYPDAEALMGTSTAGIPHAAIAAEILRLPMGYVRAQAKDHGRNNLIEGAAVDGKKVVVVEDLISTAGSAIEVVAALREAGAQVLGIASLFTYNLEKGLKRLAEAEVKNVSLSDIEALASAALKNAYINEGEFELVFKFQKNPDGWLS